MSFKREGDDKSQLNILKKRRVSDLLSHFIPDDEAALMKNGRYTCLVCAYRPVFDTVDMLTVHRKGKKHLEGLKAFYGKKAQLKTEITKRQHEKYVEAEDQTQESSSSAPLLTQTRKLTHHALLKTVPYNSRHRKTSTKSENEPTSRSCNPRSNVYNQTPSAWRENEVSSENPTADKEEVTGSPAAAAQEEKPMTAQRRRELEHYLKLKSDGWLQDRSGRWVKDENVEFDSDEDEPASVPSA
ncbi:sodium channel modifier 1 [Salarias fasciatus]|uniref:Sodium channel modifier 1 n=1 Tax=Salarias fasciatus TaxID=181472 RepID=A0A672GT68_SALFA|nr:sodium channel modifier 1 [Salarias fasciatus]